MMQEENHMPEQSGEFAPPFSPGPWRLDFDSCDCGGDYPCSHADWPYAIDGPIRPDGAAYSISEFAELSHADARLMAAAPALYALVERAVALDPHNAIAAEFDVLRREVAGEPHVPAGFDEIARRWLDCEMCGKPWPCNAPDFGSSDHPNKEPQPHE